MTYLRNGPVNTGLLKRRIRKRNIGELFRLCSRYSKKRSMKREKIDRFTQP